MKNDKNLKDLFLEMEVALKEKSKAEKTAVKAQLRQRKWHTEYLYLKDLLIHKEYLIN